MNVARVVGLCVGGGAIVTVAVVTLVIPARTPAEAGATTRVPFDAAPSPKVAGPRRARAEAMAGNTTPAESPYMQALRRHEANSNWTEFGVLAFNEAPRVTPGDRTRTLEMLMAQRSSGGFPALFCIARHHWFAGDKDEACRWFIKASVVYTVDAQRCTNPTARQAVQAVRSQFGPLTEHLKKASQEDQRQWTREALEFEDLICQREAARWIAAHGLAAAKGKPAAGGLPEDAFLPEDEWPEARSKARASIVQSLSK